MTSGFSKSLGDGVLSRWVRPADRNGPSMHGWKLKHYLQLTPRGLAVFAFGIFMVIRGVSYWDLDNPPNNFVLIEALLSTHVLGIFWGLLGVWNIVSGLLRRWVLVLSIDVGAHLAWFIVMLVAAVMIPGDLMYTSAFNFLLFAILARVILSMRDPGVVKINGVEL